MSSALAPIISDARRGLYLVGTTPPKASTDDEAMAEIGARLLARLEALEYDGLIVYDIQDESARIDKPRPFPFVGTRDPRLYSKMLREASGRPVITYKSVSQRTADDFRRWLHEAWHEYGVRDLVLVGSPSADADIRLSLREAYRLVGEADEAFNLGGVTIAERHARKGNEHLRLAEKAGNGCRFFVSQAVYDADATIALLRDHAALCQKEGRQPERIVLTFTPCGSGKTLEFMQWLGISVPDETRERILGAPNPLGESVRICRENLDKILSAALPLGIPLGLNIESLTNRKEEIEASIRLFKLLKVSMEERLRAGR